MRSCTALRMTGSIYSILKKKVIFSENDCCYSAMFLPAVIPSALSNTNKRQHRSLNRHWDGGQCKPGHEYLQHNLKMARQRKAWCRLGRRLGAQVILFYSPPPSRSSSAEAVAYKAANPKMGYKRERGQRGQHSILR